MRKKILVLISVLSRWLSGFLPGTIAISQLERIRACCGALAGIFVTALVGRAFLGSSQDLPFLIAPMGGLTPLISMR